LNKLDNIKIDLGQNSYDIVVGHGALNNAEELIKGVIKTGSKVFIITDSNVEQLYLNKLKTMLNNIFECFSIVVEAGEYTKNFDNLIEVTNAVFDNRPERGSTIIALGGGVVGDLSGFAASILLRGINFIQIPTSLLAMVDSSVGGKTGINNKFGKNLIGAFYQPKIVISDLDVLRTLPNSEAKARIVSEDEKEQGKRALLNLGHTFGHALETILKYDGTLLHGEAVAIGMLQAFRFSEYIGICETGCADRIEKLFKKYEMRTRVSDLNEGKITAERILELMYQDKKVSSGKLVLILATGIGESFVKKDVNPDQLLEFLKTEV